MARRGSVVIVGLLASSAMAMAVGACSSDDNSSDTPTKDASVSDSPNGADVSNGPPRCSGDVPVLAAFDPVTQTDIEPDLSCYVDDDAGTFLVLEDAGDEASLPDADLDADLDVAVDAPLDAIAHDGGSDAQADDAGDAGPTTHTFRVTDFLSHQPTAGANVDLFWGTTADKPSDVSATTDDAGIFSFSPPTDARLLAFRVNDSTTLTPIYWYDLAIGKATLEGASLTKQEAALLINGILGSQIPDPSKATLVSGVRDCQGREVRGGILELIDDATGQPVPSGTQQGEVRYRYFINGFPEQKCTYTNNDQSLWGVINAPTNMPGKTHGYTMRFKGRRKNDASPVLLGQKSVELWPGKTTIARAYRLTPPPR